MIEKIEQMFRDLVASLQVAKLYTTKHALFSKSVDKAFASLTASLQGRQEIVIGFVGEEIAYEKEILFDLSKATKPVIIYLKQRGVEKITFSGGVARDELEAFLAFLANAPEGADQDAQSRWAAQGARAIQVGRISSGPEERQPVASLSQAEVLDNSLTKTTDSVQSIIEGGALDYLSLRYSLNSMLEGFSLHYKEMLTLSAVKRYDSNTYMHSLNVSLLAMYFASRLGFGKDEVLDIGTAGLFHDIGKLYIANTILKKKDKLTDEEFGVIKSHTLLGSQILLGYADSIGILPVVVSYEHHLRYDLSGYPRTSYNRPLHTASLIVCICDVYDALFQRRSYKNDYPPDQVYEIMKKDRGVFFEPALFERFFKIMGVWPVGTLLGISGNRIAVVREENPDDIFLPTVEVMLPLDKKEIIDLKAASDAVTIERFVNPFKEGKELLQLISLVE